MSTSMPLLCEACGKELESPQRCGRCRQAVYCSRDCQSTHWPDHKASCTRQNYLIRFQLCPESIARRSQVPITNPLLERTLSCPANATFDQLHAALQVSFGWATIHPYDFAVVDLTAQKELGGDFADMTEDLITPSQGTIDRDSPRAYVLRVKPREGSLSPIQHVHVTQDQHHIHPGTKHEDSATLKLFQLLDNAQYKDEQLLYTYDWGDRWEHVMTVVGRDPATRRFRCTEGVGRAAPENVKQSGWKSLKEAYRTANPDKEQKEQCQWYETQAANGDPRGLGGAMERVFDMQAVNAKLSVRTI